jgi:light-regulated signal transduction histidine kinase (bacteriophytochrome)
MWFKPEIRIEKYWAGNPEKPVEVAKGQTILHPRKSFNTYIENVSGSSQPWPKEVIDAAYKLKKDLVAVELSVQNERLYQALINEREAEEQLQ